MKRYVIMIGLAIGIFSGGASAQKSTSGSFLTKLGRDTITIEQFTMAARELKGMSVSRSPRMMVRDYIAEFGPKGELRRVHVTFRRPGGALAGEREYMYAEDSVHVMTRQDTIVNKFTVAATGRPYPFFYDIFAFWQAAVARAGEAGAKEFSLLAGKRTLKYTIDGTAPGKVELIAADGDFGPLRLEAGKGMQIEKFDMTATTDKFVAERVARLDVKKLEDEFAAREKSGQALGVLSPRDTVRAEIAGAHLMVDYGRPAMRGRAIFGHVVPWDSVWRTGANAATQLITDRNLVFGATEVPAGTYSLFTVPGRDGWLLVINQQHGQWGTEYDKSKDLARIPLEVKQVSAPTERFTFEIAPAETGGGYVRFRWENTEASASFAVK